MVDTQVRPSDVTRYAIIQAMLDTPREQCSCPARLRDVAYAETEIPLGNGHASILAPRTLAKMLEAASDRVPMTWSWIVAPGLGYSHQRFSRALPRP